MEPRQKGGERPCPHGAFGLGMALIGVVFLSGCAMSKGAADDAGENEDFNLWCGDHACAWEVDEGRVEKRPTWHRKAYGIGFMSDPTRISQVIEMEDVSCLLMAVFGEIDETTSLYWEVDFDNDDIDAPDRSVPITGKPWEMMYREVQVPPGCTEARIILRKVGGGTVVIAKADIAGDSYCAPNRSPDDADKVQETDTAQPCTDTGADGGPC